EAESKAKEAESKAKEAQAAKAEGLVQGMQVGEEKGRQEVARNLLKSGMEVAVVAAATNLTLEQVKSLQ
ncbi:MAG: hypothetical protein QG673_2029, partial [Pseudomonadota bacterium]|nr:hypothetical protein [Pseudomonadota bacterium]